MAVHAPFRGAAQRIACRQALIRAGCGPSSRRTGPGTAAVLASSRAAGRAVHPAGLTAAELGVCTLSGALAGEKVVQLASLVAQLAEQPPIDLPGHDRDRDHRHQQHCVQRLAFDAAHCQGLSESPTGVFRVP